MTDQAVVRRLKDHGFVLPAELESDRNGRIETEHVEVEPQRDRFAIVSKFPTLNSVLLPIVFTLIGGLLTASYVWIRYDQNYFFGEYQEQAVSRGISDTYVEFGNSLMISGGYKAAAANYQRALDLNPNNQDAVIGLMRAQVMLPEEGEQFLSDGVVLAEIDYLLSLESEQGRNRAELYFMKGSALLSLGNTDEAENVFLAGIESDERYVGNYMGLALSHVKSEPAKAVDYALRAVELTQAADGPELAAPYLIAGLGYLLTGEWEQARQYFEAASTKTFSVAALYNLALSTRFSGAFEEAMAISERAIGKASSYDPQLLSTDPSSQAPWELYLVPQYPGDLASIRQTVTISTPQTKMALLYYAYGIDAALAGNLQVANQVFELATQLDTQGQLRPLVTNQLISAQNFLRPAEAIDQWIQAQLATLQV